MLNVCLLSTRRRFNPVKIESGVSRSIVPSFSLICASCADADNFL